MKNIYIRNTVKQNLKLLGLIGNDLIDVASHKHLFLDDWIVQNKREPGLYPKGLPWHSKKSKDILFLDQENSYLINNLGFRGENFSKENELVFAGCSFTFGIGLPENVLWGSQISNALNMKYSNLGLPGDSVVGIVSNIYKYFEEYGHPKILLCLFPDFYRFVVPINSDTLITKNNHIDGNQMLSSTHIIYQESESYAKKPYYSEEVFSVDLPFFYSYQYIRMLEKYCEKSGILFLWSTWSGNLYDLIIQQENILKSFVYLYSNKWIKDGPKDIYLEECLVHENLKDKYPKNFDMSTDIEDGLFYNKISSHSGVHKHIHWAEGFLERINDNLRN